MVIAFAYLCFTVLAPWQLGKNTKTSRENAQISRSLTAEPVPLTTVLPQQDSSAPDDQWRRVTATGHYLPDAQVLARLRVVEGDPAFEVLVPFVVDGGPTVLVDRGYVKPERGSRVPRFAHAPSRHGDDHRRLRDSETVAAGQGPVPRGRDAAGVRDRHRTDRPTLTGVPLAGSYLQLVDDQPGGLGVIALPHLDAGPFLSYGIQWIAFGILAPIGVGLLRLFRGQGAPPREGRQRTAGRASGAAHHRGEARRPLRQAALTAHVANTARDELNGPRQPHRPA